MANQYSTLTKENVIRKMNRKKDPVRSVAQLAREFGYDTSIAGSTSTAAPKHFREQLKSVIGTRTYNKLRESQSVNYSYR